MKPNPIYNITVGDFLKGANQILQTLTGTKWLEGTDYHKKIAELLNPFLQPYSMEIGAGNYNVYFIGITAPYPCLNTNAVFIISHSFAEENGKPLPYKILEVQLTTTTSFVVSYQTTLNEYFRQYSKHIITENIASYERCITELECDLIEARKQLENLQANLMKVNNK